MGAIGRARKRRWTDAAVRPIPRTIAPLTRWSCVRRRRIMAFTLRSPAFAGDDRIPHRFARDGANLSPPLEWSDPPEGTRSYALIVERSEEHTSELQSLMRISYAVFCLKKKKNKEKN